MLNFVKGRKNYAGAVSVSRMQDAKQQAEYDVQLEHKGHDFVSPYIISAVLRKGRYFYREVYHTSLSKNIKDTFFDIHLYDAIRYFETPNIPEKVIFPVYFDRDIEVQGVYYPIMNHDQIQFCVTENCNRLGLLQMKYKAVWLNIMDSKNLTVMSCKNISSKTFLPQVFVKFCLRMGIVPKS